MQKWIEVGAVSKNCFLYLNAAILSIQATDSERSEELEKAVLIGSPWNMIISRYVDMWFWWFEMLWIWGEEQVTKGRCATRRTGVKARTNIVPKADHEIRSSARWAACELTDPVREPDPQTSETLREYSIRYSLWHFNRIPQKFPWACKYVAILIVSLIIHRKKSSVLMS